MSAISSSSSYDDAVAAYLDNCGYAEDRSVAKARAFITACRALLILQPKRQRTGSNHETEFNIEGLNSQIDKAQAWINANRSTSNGGYRHYSMQNFRG